MEIVDPASAPAVEHADAVRLLHEMAAVVRTIFAVNAAGATAPAAGAVTSTADSSAPTIPSPSPVEPAREPAPAPTLPTSIPVPGMALLQEIAFLDD